MRRFLRHLFSIWGPVALLLVSLPALNVWSETTATPLRHPQWVPTIKYVEDNFGRHHWVFEETLTFGPQGRTAWFLKHLWGSFVEGGIDSVSDNAGGFGIKQALCDKQNLSLLGMFHDFSSNVDELLAGEIKLDSQWSDLVSTNLEIAREPADTAQAIQSGIHEEYGKLKVQLKPIRRLTFRSTDEVRFLSDDNRHYKTEFETAYDLPAVPGLQAVYLFTAENMVEQKPQYYSPNRVKLHQAGLAYYAESTDRWWIWARYLIGHGTERNVPSGLVHAVDTTSSLHLTKDWSLDVSFGWSQSVTYHSTTTRAGFTYRF